MHIVYCYGQELSFIKKKRVFHFVLKMILGKCSVVFLKPKVVHINILKFIHEKVTNRGSVPIYCNIMTVFIFIII